MIFIFTKNPLNKIRFNDNLNYCKIGITIKDKHRNPNCNESVSSKHNPEQGVTLSD